MRCHDAAMRRHAPPRPRPRVRSPSARRFQVDPVSYLDVLSAYADEEDATVLDMLLEKLLQLHGLLQVSGRAARERHAPTHSSLTHSSLTHSSLTHSSPTH
eukprot:7387354-Prymnesium_polylepis.1